MIPLLKPLQNCWIIKVNKKKEILFNSNNFLLALSPLLDKVEQHRKHVSEHHIKRVAYLSLKIGQKFNLSQEQLFALCAYALAHSIALYAFEEENKAYCESIENFIQTLPLQQEQEILKYHKEYYNGSGLFGLKDASIPLFSQIIAFADLIDTQFDLSNNSLQNRKAINRYIKRYEQTLFSLDMSEIFCDELAIEESFWLDLQHETQMLHFIFNTLEDFSKPITFDALLKITSYITTLIHPQSQLIDHAASMADYYHFEHKDKLTFMIAASLSMLGKLALPIDFQSKPTLSESEQLLKKAYPYYTKLALSNIMGFSDICSWASKVQESIDGTGYPFALQANALSFKDQLLAILIKYESLSNKSYGNTFLHDDAIKELETVAKKGCFDISIVQDIQQKLA